MSTEAERQSITRIFYRFVAALLCSSFVVYLAGNVKPPCDACGREHGWPMVYYREAAFMGGAEWIWMGLLADTALCFLASIAFTFLWSMAAQFAKVRVEEESR